MANSRIVNHLRRLIDNRWLASQRPMKYATLRDTRWYKEALAEKGKVAAEAEIANFDRKSRGKEFAEAIEPIARAMLAMAVADADGEFSHIVPVQEQWQMRIPYCYELSAENPIIAIMNQPWRACGCDQPGGANNWSTDGVLGLKGITLHAGWSQTGAIARLALLLPKRHSEDSPFNANGFVTLALDLEGHDHAEEFRPFIDGDDYLKAALGIIGFDEVAKAQRTGGGDTDNRVGFPGATNYIADALPELPIYLTALAAQLSGDHKH